MRNQQYIYNFDGFDPIFELNNPKSDPLYVGSIPVFCAFCKQSSEDIKILGPLYGPFIRKKKNKSMEEYYVHLMCALWSDSVFISETDHLMNVDREITKSLTQECQICGDYGASLKCHAQNCQVLYHCRCFLLDYEKFLQEIPILQPRFYFYCMKHARLAENDQNFLEDMKIEWIELICVKCKILDCDILCDKCDSAFHLACLDLEEEPGPQELWFCGNCQKYMNVGKKQNIRAIEDD